MIKYDDIKDKKYRVVIPFVKAIDIKPKDSIRTTFGSLTQYGRLTIHKGFCWDGPTGMIDTESTMQSSCIHDILCEWYADGLLTKEERKQADQLFKAENKATNMPSIRIKYSYQAVRKFLEVKDKLLSFFR